MITDREYTSRGITCALHRSDNAPHLLSRIASVQQASSPHSSILQWLLSVRIVSQVPLCGHHNSGDWLSDHSSQVFPRSSDLYLEHGTGRQSATSDTWLPVGLNGTPASPSVHSSLPRTSLALLFPLLDLDSRIISSTIPLHLSITRRWQFIDYHHAALCYITFSAFQLSTWGHRVFVHSSSHHSRVITTKLRLLCWESTPPSKSLLRGFQVKPFITLHTVIYLSLITDSKLEFIQLIKEL